ncbi:hypothetical protein HPB52_018203 [Rhipicephalus sanguineus]|uniref:Uncharacterized protein n=1 Tax=Rhipicephalus sanguineus TaxID=34632 RepID=A0A9D4TB99_RHISA|nr:hypothetical protein HPB52_018203 [Rhipicephalus sanguineus]
MAAIRKKPMIVGDGQGSKTRLLLVFGNGELSGTLVATVFENYVAPIKVVVETASCDTAGQKDYGRLTPLSYPDVILMCFSSDSPGSLAKNQEVHMPEVRHFCPSVTIILAANKSLRNHLLALPDMATARPIDAAPEQGNTIAKEPDACGLPGVLRQDQGRCARGL